MIRFGNQNHEVQQWQAFLAELGYDVAIDGIYGQGTYSATIHYQQSCGLGADGIVGPNTYSWALSHGYMGDYA